MRLFRYFKQDILNKIYLNLAAFRLKQIRYSDIQPMKRVRNIFEIILYLLWQWREFTGLK